MKVGDKVKIVSSKIMSSIAGKSIGQTFVVQKCFHAPPGPALGLYHPNYGYFTILAENVVKVTTCPMGQGT